MGKRPESYYESDDDADEPEEFQDSEDSWTPEDDNKKQDRKRRSITMKNATKKRKSVRTRSRAISNSSSSSDSGENEEAEDSGDNFKSESEDEPESEIVENHRSKKRKVEPKIPPKDQNSQPSKPLPRSKASPLFPSGSFVASKSDLAGGGLKVNTSACIWRIDGSTLLQKFTREEVDGKVSYIATPVYTCWDARKNTIFVQIKIKNESSLGNKFEKVSVVSENVP